MFSSFGFYLLPIDYKHPWLVYILLSFIVLVISINGFLVKGKKKTPILFMFSVYAIGSFFYFQGRSHSYTFLSIYGNMFVLAALIADYLVDSIIIHKKDLMLKFYWLVIVFCMSFSVYGIFESQYKMMKKGIGYEQCECKLNEAEIALIEKYAEKEDKILLIDLYLQGQYLSKTRKQSAFNVGIIDMFYKADLMRLLDIISSKKYQIYICESIKQNDQKMMEVIDKYYIMKEKSSNLYYYQQR